MFDHIPIYNIEFLQKCDKNAKNICKSVTKQPKTIAKTWRNVLKNLQKCDDSSIIYYINYILYYGDDLFEKIYIRKINKLEK